MPENDLVSMRRGYLRKAEEERMRLATWKLAVLMGVVPTIGCVQKIVPSEDGPQLGNDAGLDMDAMVNPDPSDASKPDAGKPDAGGQTGGLSCITYCTEVMGECEGAFRQYESMDQCMNMCADMDLGADNDASGNTVGCRITHVRRGVMMGALEVHCKHAGPSGGLVCGGYCDNLCSRATKLCVQANGIQNDAYESYDDCMSACEVDDAGVGGYPVNRDQDLPATGDSVNCRIYHLANAYKYISGPQQDDIQLNAHCEHTARFSPTCN
jgi:hypothetical protein